MAQTLMAHSPGLARTIIMVHKDHSMYKPPTMAGTTLPKPVRAIEVLLYKVNGVFVSLFIAGVPVSTCQRHI